MPDWWGAFLVAVVGVILLVVFIVGLTRMVKDLHRETIKVKVLVTMSLLLVPAMFSTCVTINLASKDEAHDAFGFERPVLKELPPSGFETRSSRRATVSENQLAYLTSAHGIVSMATAILVGIPFILSLRKLLQQKGSVGGIEGYWQVAIPLALAFLVLLARNC